MSLAYVWNVDGVEVSGFNSPSLPGAAWFDAGAVVYVTVTPSDGTLTGAAVASNAVVVANSPPTVGAVEIDPGAPDTCDTALVCAVTYESTDADGDAVSLVVSWTRDGVAVDEAATTTTVPPGDTLAIVGDEVGTIYACSVEASDGADEASVSAAATLGDPELEVVGWFDTQPAGCGDGKEGFGTAAKRRTPPA